MTVYAPSPITGHSLTSEDAAKGGHALARKTWREHIQRAQRAQLLDQIIEAIEEGEIGQGALEVAGTYLVKLEGMIEQFPIESSLDAVRLASVVETLFKVHRLASGQSTSNVAHANVTDDERATRVAELRARTDALDA